MIVANFPHNPTGATLTPDERKELLRLTEEAGIYLVWDGAFSALTYEMPPPCPSRRLTGRVLSIGTLSKAYGLPGLRVGWCLGAPALLQRLVEPRDHVTLHLSPLVELVAARVIRHGERLIAPRLAQARRNRELLAEWVEGHSGLVEWVPAAGGVCAFIHLVAVPDVDAFCHRLAREHGVLLVPGSCFGHPRHARLGFGGGSDSFQDRPLPAFQAPALRLQGGMGLGRGAAAGNHFRQRQEQRMTRLILTQDEAQSLPEVDPPHRGGP